MNLKRSLKNMLGGMGRDALYAIQNPGDLLGRFATSPWGVMCSIIIIGMSGDPGKAIKMLGELQILNTAFSR